MKKTEFEKLKVGDKVTVRTIKELKSLQGTRLDRNGNLRIEDYNTMANTFTLEHNPKSMRNFCGGTYVVSFKSMNSVRFEGDSVGWAFTRKMLRNKKGDEE